MKLEFISRQQRDIQIGFPAKPIGNSIRVINTYKWNKAWVFDDEAVGLVKEPFVAGADDLIQYIADSRLGGVDNVTIFFSDAPFPDAQITINKLDKEATGESGADYFCPELLQNLWLCPALLKYFDFAPSTIWAKFK